MTIADWIKLALEYLAGEQDDPPPGFPATLGAWWFWAAWWTAMAVLIYVFAGQGSKFIYINF